MFHIYSSLKSWFKIRYRRSDGSVFRLHYQITTSMLVLFTAILATRQYVGNPIDCIHTKDIDEDVLNTYCWIHSTYAMKYAFKKDVPRIYPGVATSRRDKNSEEDIKLYPYYQWVVFCLFFQVCSPVSVNFWLHVDFRMLIFIRASGLIGGSKSCRKLFCFWGTVSWGQARY